MSDVITGLVHHFVLAGPQLAGSFFEHSVIYICKHDDEGAMGLMLNQPDDEISFEEIVHNMGIASSINAMRGPVVLSGGPVEPARGFVLHSDDYEHESTLKIGSGVHMSGNTEIVSAIAGGSGPESVNFCLGYSGWGPQQLEDEVAENSWIVVPADKELLFYTPPQERYAACMKKLGFDENRLLHMDNVGIS